MNSSPLPVPHKWHIHYQIDLPPAPTPPTTSQTYYELEQLLIISNCIHTNTAKKIDFTELNLT